MKTHYCIILAFAALNLAACDLVKLPGVSPKKEAIAERPLPPPPGLQTPPQDAATPAIGDPAPQTVSETKPDETLPPNTPEREANPAAGTSDEPSYAAIDNLLSINAARCAPTSAEASLTLAEMTSARAASATVTAQAVNATAITSAAFPGIVKMEPKRTLDNGGISSGHCGATRIAHNWFVTASHCLDDIYDQIDLIATSSSLSDPRAIRVTATASLCHAAYGGARGQYANDVALVAISDEAASTLNAVPIARFGATDKPLGSLNYPRARMAGWGLTSFEGGQLSNELLSAELTLVSSGPALVTVASLETAGPCVGDSGGPLLIDEADGTSKVIGVLSVVENNRITGEFCKGDYNARYTNLQGFTDWIDSVIGVCTASPALCAR